MCLEGELTFTRALGDANYKPALSAEPEIYEISLEFPIDFIIITTDGFWNVIYHLYIINLGNFSIRAIKRLQRVYYQSID